MSYPQKNLGFRLVPPKEPIYAHTCHCPVVMVPKGEPRVSVFDQDKPVGFATQTLPP
jgi:hypothetical protein